MNKKINQLYLALLGITLSACSSGNNENGSSNSGGSVSSLVFTQPYLLPSFESTVNNGFIVINNLDESRSVNNIQYSLNAITGDAGGVMIDESSALACASIESSANCTLKIVVPKSLYGGSFTLGASNDNKQLQEPNPEILAAVPVGVQSVLTTTTSGVNGIQLFYYPVITKTMYAVIIEGVVVSNNTGKFNSASLLDVNGSELKGQKDISGNLGMGKPSLKQGDSFSILIPIPVESNILQFKLHLSEISANGIVTNQQTASLLSTITIVNDEALLYNYPANIRLTPANINQSVVVANIGAVEATDYSVKSSNPSIATVTNESITTDFKSKRGLNSNVTPGGYGIYVVNLTNPSSPSNSSFSIIQTYYNGKTNITTTNEASSSNTPWPSPTPTPTPSPTPTPAPAPIACSWRELGNASNFFSVLPNYHGTNTKSPMLLSSDQKTLYVGGKINYNEEGPGFGVAKIDLEDSSAEWTTVADSENVLQSFNNLTSLALVNQDLYVGGNGTFDGEEQPALYLSSSGSNWTRIRLNFINLRDYGISALSAGQDALYVTGSDGTNSFVANYAAATWNLVANAQTTFNSIIINSMINAGNNLYVAGSADDHAAVYRSINNGDWEDISPDFKAGSQIYSLTLSSSYLYAGGVLGDFSEGVAYSLFLEDLSWSNIGAGAFYLNNNSSWVNSIYFSNNKLYAGGNFESHVSVTSSNSINWTEVWDAGDVLDGAVSNIVVADDGTIYADGEFSQKVVKLVCQ